MRRSGGQRLALALAAIPLAGSACIALFALVWGLGLQCDESCTGEDWQHTAGAGQWTVLTLAGLAVFAAGIALVGFVYRRRSRPALACVAFGTLTIVVTLTWWGMDLILELGRHPGAFAAFGCVLLAGALAALLCAPALSTGRTG